jgi:hypothetical protein
VAHNPIDQLIVISGSRLAADRDDFARAADLGNYDVVIDLHGGPQQLAHWASGAPANRVT